MACSTVDDRAVCDVLTIVDEDCPDVDECEQCNVSELLKWEDEWENVVWHALCEAINWVESVACVWCWHDPLVVWLVESLVYPRVVQSTVDPVDQEVGEEDEDGELEVVVEVEWCFGGCIVEFAVASDFSGKEWARHDGHDGHCYHCLLHLEANLVLEVFRVLECVLVEDEEIGERSANKIDE